MKSSAHPIPHGPMSPAVRPTSLRRLEATSSHRMILRIPSQDRRLHTLQMRAHPRHRQRLVAALDRLENFEMPLMIRLARAEDPQDEALLVGEELVQDVQQLGGHG